MTTFDYIYTHRLEQGMRVRRLNAEEDAQIEGEVVNTELVKDSIHRETPSGRYVYSVKVTFKDGSEATTLNTDRWKQVEA